MARTVMLVPHDDGWREEFRREASLLRSFLGNNVESVHHIGSTAIPGIAAKPVIDILLVVPAVTILDAYSANFEEYGYAALGEYGIPGRRFYTKGGDKRSHHIHAFGEGSPHITRHLLFRDYLRFHPEAAKEYEALKRELAVRFAADPEAYAEAKTDFIRSIEREASENRG